jgi:fructoselysine transporter
MSKLIRGLNLSQATSLNMIDMVGIGPFVTIPFIIHTMGGPQCILAWLLGALLSFMDAFVWSELGAKWPQAGGSYVFLQKLYGKKYGRMLSFLFVWQTSIQAPLVVASGSIGFAQYLTYLLPLTDIEQKMVSGSLVLLLVWILYRNIKTLGKLSVIMWVVVGSTILWLIASAFTHFDAQMAFSFPVDAFDLKPMFFVALGQASVKSIYSYLGYYNVCHLGGEIINPQKNIPRSIFISIAGIAALYISMQIGILGVIPWQEAQNSTFIVSAFFEKLYGHATAQFATGLILFIAITSLFAVMLGYSRVPYAAARDGNFFKVFAKLHPTKNFPYISLLVLGGLAFCFSLLFKLKDVITAIIVMRILVQFISQSVGLIALHYRSKKLRLPYKMPLFPIPAILGILVWLFVFLSSDWQYIVGALGIIVSGLILYFIKEHYTKTMSTNN